MDSDCEDSYCQNHRTPYPYRVHRKDDVTGVTLGGSETTGVVNGST